MYLLHPLDLLQSVEKINFYINTMLPPGPGFKGPVILLLAVPRRLFCFGSLVVLDVVCGYVSLFLLNIK